MHSFEVNSNESACRKSGRLELDRVFSAPRADYFEIIYLKKVGKLLWINPMELSSPWDDSLVIIVLQPVKQLPGIDPMGLSVPWDHSLCVIAFQTTTIN